jgi:hypothetical protein
MTDSTVDTGRTKLDSAPYCLVIMQYFGGDRYVDGKGRRMPVGCCRISMVRPDDPVGRPWPMSTAGFSDGHSFFF